MENTNDFTKGIISIHKNGVLIFKNPNYVSINGKQVWVGPDTKEGEECEDVRLDKIN